MARGRRHIHSRSYADPRQVEKLYLGAPEESYRRAVKDVNHRVVDYVRKAYKSSPGFIADQGQIDQLTSLMVPAVQAGQLQVADLTNAHLSNLFGVEHPPASQLSLFDRPGVDKKAELARPFWTAIRESEKGKTLDQAMQAGGNRLEKMVETDLQMAKVRQSREVLKAGGIERYGRATGASPCWLCAIASTQTYFTKDLLPIHASCGCSVIPVEMAQAEEFNPKQTLTMTDDQAKMMSGLVEKEASIREFQKRVAVREHGEIGPVLTWKHQHFTGPKDVAAWQKTAASGVAKDPRLAGDAYRIARENHGVTIDLGRNRPTEGYAYAPLKSTEVSYALDEFTPEHLDAFIDANFVELNKPGNNLGLWEQDGKMYIDVSRVGPPTPKTIEIAQKADQLAVFDLKSFDEVNIGKVDTSGKYTRIGKASDLHNQHRREVARRDETGSAPGTSALRAGERTATGLAPPHVAPLPDGYSYTRAESLLTDKKYSAKQRPGQEIPLRHDIGGDSTDAQMDAEAAKYTNLTASQKAVARTRADELFELNSAQAAPARTEMRSIAADLGGIMEREYEHGVPTAVKTRNSTYRKVMKAQADGTDPSDYVLGDGVRFTVSFPEDSYWESTRALSKRIRDNGYKVEEGPNGWALHTYRGQNMKFSKDGVNIEVQTHTPYSVYVAEVNHGIYNKTRDPVWDKATPQSVKDQWAATRRSNLEAIPVPRKLPIMNEKDGPTSFLVGDKTRIVLVEPVPSTVPIPKGGTPGDFPRHSNRARVGAELRARHPELTSVKLNKSDLEVARETARATDKLATKYPSHLRSVAETRDQSGWRFAETGTPGVLDLAGRRDPTATEIRMNPVLAKDVKVLNKEYAKTVASGYHPPIGDHTATEAIVTHEYGHVLDATGSYRASRDASKTLKRVYLDEHPQVSLDTISRDDYERWLKENLSGYSIASNGHLKPTEAVSEAFAHVELDPGSANSAEKALHDLTIRSSKKPKLRSVTEPKWVDAASKSEGTPAKKVTKKEQARLDKAAKKAEVDRVKAIEKEKGYGVVQKRIPKGTEVQPVYSLNKDGTIKMGRNKDGSTFKVIDAKSTWEKILGPDGKGIETLRQNWRFGLDATSPWAMKAGKKWYPELGRMVDRLVGQYGKVFEAEWGIPLTKDLASSFMATWSENNSWTHNLLGVRKFLDGTGKRPAKMFNGKPFGLKDYDYSQRKKKIMVNGKTKTVYRWPTEDGEPYDFHVDKALQAMQNPKGGIASLRANDATAPKPADFGANIAGDLSKGTADRWVARIMLHTDDSYYADVMRKYDITQKKIKNPLGYKRMSKVLEDVARERPGLNTAAVQAGPWIQVVGPKGAISYVEDLSSFGAINRETLRRVKKLQESLL